MKILVTGATGTVGGHVARLLAASGHPDLTVSALVRDPAKAAADPGLAGVELVADEGFAQLYRINRAALQGPARP